MAQCTAVFAAVVKYSVAVASGVFFESLQLKGCLGLEEDILCCSGQNRCDLCSVCLLWLHSWIWPEFSLITSTSTIKEGKIFIGAQTRRPWPKPQRKTAQQWRVCIGAIFLLSDRGNICQEFNKAGRLLRYCLVNNVPEKKSLFPRNCCFFYLSYMVALFDKSSFIMRFWWL